MRVRKICCFCESWESGGIESFLSNVLLHMDLSQMQVDVVAAQIKPSVFTPGLKARGVHFIELSGDLRSTKNCCLFRKLIRERKYDVIHFNLFQGLALYYVCIAKKAGVPVRISHSHGMGLRDSRTKRLKLLLHCIGRILWKNTATDCWACSKAAANFLFGEENQARIIPNGIDVGKLKFSQKSRELIRTELGLADELLIGTVGRMSQEKNQLFLPGVFLKFQEIKPNSRIIFVGSGTEEPLIKKKVSELGIESKTIFYGVSDRVEKLLCAMDVFVFPSLMEGLGIAAIEAQASGLPVLCSQFIPDEAKITPLCNALPLNAEMWAQKLPTLHAQERERYAEQVRSAGFDITDVAAEIEKNWLR